MKTAIHLPVRASGGYALLMVMIMTAAALLILGVTVNRTTTSATLNERSNEYVEAVNAAEAATEKVVGRMRCDYLFGGEVLLANNLNSYRLTPPSATEDPYWANFEFNDASGGIGRTYVQVISNRVYTPLQSQFYGLNGWRSVYRVVSNARRTDSRFNVIGAVQQDIEVDSIPVFQFAIFYNSLLEFTWAAPLTVRGRTHANGNIYTGSSADLTFKELVTAAGIIQKRGWAGYSLSQMNGDITFTGNPGYSTNVPVLSLPIGTNNTPNAVREIINMPPPGESVNSALGQERYYNKAGMVLLVSNSTVTAIIKNAPDDPAPVTLVTNYTGVPKMFPFLNLNASFTDQREDKIVKATEIDMAKYAQWASTNVYTKPTGALTKHPPSNPLNILYVADNRSLSSSYLPAVRLKNGADLPKNPGSSGQPTGLTIATPNPLYVYGDYNAPVAAHRNTTNTSATVPASLLSDALTVLSANWQDSESDENFKYRDAANTTINAAIVTGVVYSKGSSGTSPFSGGVMNMPRLLEDWGNGQNQKLTLNTSMVNLFDSVRATAPFQLPGYYYYAPIREFNFDQNFKDPTKLPPGTPMLGVILRARWVNPPPNTTTYAGN